MADQEHIRILKQGVNAFNEWREENLGVKPNLIKADLRKADLRAADLSEANLHGADLSEANISGTNLNWANVCEANLSWADLRKADLSEANLCRASFRGANLRGANLYGANLSRVDFRETILRRALLCGANLREAYLKWASLSWADLNGADLKNANLSFATIGYTTFGNNDLSSIIGLESTDHIGPSTIGIDTIFRSGGKIPHKFLEGAGVPEIFIQYMGSLTGKGFQFYSCFISYSNQDEEFAKRIHGDLRKNEVRCWFAPEDMKIGDEIRPAIEKEIRLRDKVLLVLSDSSIKSEWVKDEVEAAYEEERQKKETVLFPIRIDESIMITKQSWAAKLRRQRKIGDFTDWKNHDSYQQAFKRLLRDFQPKDH